MDITVDDILSWDPCGTWHRRRIEKLGAGRESMTPAQLFDAFKPEIPREDLWWLLFRRETLSTESVRRIVKKAAVRVLTPTDETWLQAMLVKLPVPQDELKARLGSVYSFKKSALAEGDVRRSALGIVVYRALQTHNATKKSSIELYANQALNSCIVHGDTFTHHLADLREEL